TTDIIAGFPGETEAEFAESVEFVQAMEFAGGHPFSYSPRPGTGAARMSGQIPPDVRKDRNARYRSLLDTAAEAYRRRFIGQQLPVLWESTTQLDESGWEMAGWTGNYLRVAARASRAMWNEISQVRLEALNADGLSGLIAA
ncbi:MAG: tRNA (N(6)-L-threonylcarbamoyladenosine(37)-C(2))-methylthiotransferase MtaB, partial [Anaerolineales bacterium]